MIFTRTRSRTAAAVAAALTLFLGACGSGELGTVFDSTAATTVATTDQTGTTVATTDQTGTTITTTDQTGTTIDLGGPATVTLAAPDGWTTRTDGLTLAEDGADLHADAPQGPRIRAVTEFGEDPPAHLGQSPTGAVAILKDPAPLTVDGVDATMIVTGETVDGRELARAYVVAAPATSDAILFILEAPAANWDSVRDTLIDSIKIETP